jgi:epoxyqueuosine reductase
VTYRHWLIDKKTGRRGKVINRYSKEANLSDLELTKKIKELALANDLDYVGIAPAERLQNEPEGKRPEDFLPGARSVIAIGIKINLGPQLANRLAYHHYHHIVCSYLWHGFGLPNLHYLDRTALLITRLLEKERHIAVPMQASSPFDLHGSLTEFSNIHAAVAAGLGEMGWNGFVLTPDVGPRARFGSVITTAELEPDPMYHGPKRCDPDKCREQGRGEPVCVRVCPVGAYKKEPQQLIIGGQTFQIAGFDRNKHFWGSIGLSEGSLTLRPVPMPEKVEIADVFKGMAQRDPVQARELMVIGRGDYCGKCFMECPVGRPKIIDEIMSKVSSG